MSASINPLLPTGHDVLWTVVLVVIVSIAVVALAQLVRSKALTGLDAGVWVLIILALPALGPIAWFVMRPDRRATSTLRS